VLGGWIFHTPPSCLYLVPGSVFSNCSTTAGLMISGFSSVFGAVPLDGIAPGHFYVYFSPPLFLGDQFPHPSTGLLAVAIEGSFPDSPVHFFFFGPKRKNLTLGGPFLPTLSLPPTGPSLPNVSLRILRGFGLQMKPYPPGHMVRGPDFADLAIWGEGTLTPHPLLFRFFNILDQDGDIPPPLLRCCRKVTTF